MTEQQLNKHNTVVAITVALSEEGANFSTDTRRTLIADTTGHVARLDDEGLALMHSLSAGLVACRRGEGDAIDLMYGILGDIEDMLEEGVSSVMASSPVTALAS